MRKLIVPLFLLALTSCVTVEDSPGRSHKVPVVHADYMHIALWDRCAGKWYRSTEQTYQCRCFDENGKVLPACDVKALAPARKAAKK